MKTSIVAALACALALSSPDFAQSQGSAANQEGAQQSPLPEKHAKNPTQSTQGSESQSYQDNVLTINKLKQDLENAGFSDVKILGDSFIVQAKDKQGNPTVMSLSPGGVVAFSVLNQQRQAKASNSNLSSKDSEVRHQ